MYFDHFSYLRDLNEIFIINKIISLTPKLIRSIEYKIYNAMSLSTEVMTAMKEAMKAKDQNA